MGEKMATHATWTRVATWMDPIPQNSRGNVGGKCSTETLVHSLPDGNPIHILQQVFRATFRFAHQS